MRLLLLLFISVLFFSAPSANAQAIVKGSGIVYTNGAPTHTVNLNADAEVAIDTTTGYWHERSRDGLGWILAGFRVQKFPFSIAPTAAPLDKQSEVLLNDVDSLYRWRAGAWRHLNPPEVDGSVTNEGVLGVGAGGGTSSTLLSNTSGANPVTINAAGILAITESTSANGGSITLTATEIDGSITNENLTISDGVDSENLGGQTLNVTGGGIAVVDYIPGSNTLNITATEVDGSVSNELQTLANTSDATSHTVTLSNSGGSFKIAEGANITITTSGTGSDGIATIASTSAADGNGPYSGNGGNGGDGTVPSVTKSTVTNQWTIYRATDDAGGLVPARIEVNAGNEPDFLSMKANATGDSLLFGHADVEFTITSSSALNIGTPNGNTNILAGGSVAITADSIQASTIPTAFDNEATLLFVSPNNTIVKAEGLDPDIIRQNGATSGQVLEWNGTKWAPATDDTGAGSTDLTFTGGASPYTLNSSTGTDVTFAEGAGITLSRVTNELTITAVDQSATNEAWTIDGDDAETEVISNQTVKFQGAGITATDYDAATNVLLITSTEVDGSVSNELQTLANTSNATTHTVTLSNTGGSIQFAEGTGIGLATTGTGLDGVLTITNTAPDQTVSITGAGISVVTGTYPNFTVTSTEVDGSITNEGLLGVGAGGASSSVLLSNTSTATGVTINVAGINTISETTSANGGQITITATEVDGSTTNELQTIANTSNATTHTATLSNSGGSLQLAEGTGITLTTSGTGLDGIVTIAATTQATDLTFTGSGPYTLNSSTGTDVTITQGSGIVITRTSNDLSFAASDVSATNELQTLASTSDATSHTVTLSSTGGSIQFVEGSGITLTTSGTGLDGIVTIASTVSSPVANNGLSDNENSGNFRLGNRYMNSSDGLFSFDRKINLNAFRLFIGDNTDSTLLHVDGTNDRVGIHTTAPGRTFTVNGEVEIKDLTTTNPTFLVGVDANGVLSEVTLGTGLSFTGTTLNASGGGGGDVLNNGNSFGAAFIVGSNDNNAVSLEQNGTTVVTIGTDKNITATNSVAATNTVTDQVKLNINSTGTAANSFGNAILFSGESSTTNDQEMARERVYWTNATHANREAAISWMTANNGGALEEVMKLDRVGDIEGMLSVGQTNPVQIYNDGIAANTNFDISANLSTLNLVRVVSATAAVQKIGHQAISSGTAANGFGVGLDLNGETSTGAQQDMGGIDAVWTDATNATRTSNLVFYAVNNATAEAEALRLYGNQRAMVGGGTNQAAAAFQVNSTTGGILPPKVTTTEMNAIASPVEGLSVYNTTEKGDFKYDGTAWHRSSMDAITGRSTAQTAAVASVATLTVGASDASYLVKGNILVTTSGSESFSLQVDWTDEGNTARTATIPMVRIATGGFTATTISASGAVPYPSTMLEIRCKASTAITIKTSGTFTGCTYNVEGFITRIQ